MQEDTTVEKGDEVVVEQSPANDTPAEATEVEEDANPVGEATIVADEPVDQFPATENNA